MRPLETLPQSESGTRRFRYPDKLRQLDLGQELLYGWLGLGGVWLLLLGAMSLSLLWKEGQGFVIGAILFIAFSMTQVGWRWRKRLLSCHADLQSEVVLEGKQIYLIRNNERRSVQVLAPP